MNSKDCVPVLQIALCFVLAVGQSGCGGASPTTLPPTVSVTVSPASVTVQAGSTQQFTAIVTNDPSNKGVVWTISPVTGSGTVSGATGTSVTYAAPPSAASTLNLTITATSVSNPAKSASASVTVAVSTADILLNVFPPSAVVGMNGTAAISANVTNDPNHAGVIWNIGDCAGGASVCGSITNSTPNTADYVAPATLPPGGRVSVIATSVTDATKSASVLLAISRFGFTSRNYLAGNNPDAVAVGDFNGDGKLDIAVADFGNPSTGDNGGVSILLGNGDGTFQPPRLINAGNNPNSIVVGDFNNDGKQDLLLANLGDLSSGANGGLTLLLGNGDGMFQPPITITAGLEPVILPSAAAVAGVQSFNVAVGDFNHDGKLDFAVTDFSAGVNVLLGNGDGSFRPPALFRTASNPSAIVVSDFNGDGQLDLAVACLPPAGSYDSSPSTIAILLGNGDGTFESPISSPVTLLPFPISIAAGDINGDGRTDLAITSFLAFFSDSGSTITLLGNGDGTFQSTQSVWSYVARNAPIPLSIHIADLFGNGKGDLVQIVGRTVPSTVWVFPGNGDGTFQGPLAFLVDLNPVAVAIADFNGDGKPDIVVANQGSNDVTVLLNATVP